MHSNGIRVPKRANASVFLTLSLAYQTNGDWKMGRWAKRSGKACGIVKRCVR